MDAFGTKSTMPSLEEFAAQLTREQAKLLHMGTLKSPRKQALVATQSTKDPKASHNKEKKHKDSQPNKQEKESKKTPNSSSKEESNKKKKPKCSYCKKLGHDETKCYEKKFEEMSQLLQKHNIEYSSSTTILPKSSSSPQSSSTSTGTTGIVNWIDKGKGQALFASTSLLSERWLLDSGASHHMASSQGMFSSFQSCTSPPILMGNNTYMHASGKGTINVGDLCTLNNVLCVPSLTTNLLSIYQITHSGAGKTVEFTPDFVIIWDLESRGIIAVGMADHASCLYTFSHFVSDDDVDPLIDIHTHAASVNHISREKFGHLNLGVLASALVPETSFELPPSPASSEIGSDIASSTSVEQDILCLPDTGLWDEYLTGISDLFHASYLDDLEDIIDDIHLLFEGVESSTSDEHTPSSLHLSQFGTKLENLEHHSEDTLSLEIDDLEFSSCPGLSHAAPDYVASFGYDI